jgi:hypothetical protein
MPKHPLSEVFGFPMNNFSPDAERYRANKLCPFNNKVPSCTKDKAENPLGVCSVFDGDKVVVTCPVRLGSFLWILSKWEQKHCLYSQRYLKLREKVI